MTSSEKLRQAVTRTGSLISAGIEPAANYLPASGEFEATPGGYLEFFKVFIEATRDRVAAYKFNLAFFESQGVEGWRLLHAVREMIPAEAFVIADAKRGDIGTTAKHYAKSLFEDFAADAVTVNPLMGRDSAEPFLAYEDRMTYFLALTSNPGAADFILPERLFERIAASIESWGDGRNAGLVVGATKGAEDVRAVRGAAPSLPFLVPGLGAQGGSAETVIGAGAMSTEHGLEGLGLLLHSTRGLLPGATDAGRDVAEVIREKTKAFARQIEQAATPVLAGGSMSGGVKR
ncbi:MAG: orotidine-5'-phosphate decarboxylase [Phycisphaerales bacterium JB065]